MTADLMLDYIRALSADLRAAVVLDAAGELLAGPPALHRPAKELLAHAPAATAIEGRTPDGAAFAARDGERAIVAVTGPHALSRLTLHDLRTALSAPRRGTGFGAPAQAVPESAVTALLSVISAS